MCIELVVPQTPKQLTEIELTMEANLKGYLERARVGRLATVDPGGCPHIVPICYTLLDETIVSPIDEKPKQGEPLSLRRCRNIQTNPNAAIVVDTYTEDWDTLGWVQLRGQATIEMPDWKQHALAIDRLREKYPQYDNHHLEDRPVITLDPSVVRSWGTLE